MLYRNVFEEMDKRDIKPIVSIPDLIEMKTKIARPRDLLDVDSLRQLMELDNE